MANIVTAQVITDGPRATFVKILGIIDTSNVTNALVIDPAQLSGMDNTGLVKAKHFRVQEITYMVSGAMSVNLYWNALVPVPMVCISGSNTADYEEFGGLTDTSGTDSDGKITLSTTGWVGVQTFTIVLELYKQET